MDDKQTLALTAVMDGIIGHSIEAARNELNSTYTPTFINSAINMLGAECPDNFYYLWGYQHERTGEALITQKYRS